MQPAAKVKAVRQRLAGLRRRPLPGEFAGALRGLDVLEVGGPSAVFGTAGLLPAYAVARRVDCLQWSAETVWHGDQGAGDFAPAGRPLGRMVVADDPTLTFAADGAYGAVISSHVIEHLADPLGALRGWRRATGDGVVVVIAPHMEGTFDHRRPVTPLAHLVEDAERRTGEDDLTHLEETLALHDRRRDAEGPDQEAWAAKRRDNLRWRVLHHHVFTTRSLLELLDHAGVQVVAAQARLPHDVYVVGRFVAAPDNARFLGARSAVLRTSPFRRDRADASRPSASAPAVAR